MTNEENTNIGVLQRSIERLAVTFDRLGDKLDGHIAATAHDMAAVKIDVAAIKIDVAMVKGRFSGGWIVVTAIGAVTAVVGGWIVALYTRFAHYN